MQLVKFIPIVFIIFGIFPYENLVHAGSENPKNYKVLAAKNKKLSIDNVKYYLKEGDKFINSGEFDEAKESYLNAIFEKLEINETDLIDKAIIFLGIIELEQEKFPKEVTFDECIRLARKFSNPESYKFINACLDKFSKLN